VSVALVFAAAAGASSDRRGSSIPDGAGAPSAGVFVLHGGALMVVDEATPSVAGTIPYWPPAEGVRQELLKSYRTLVDAKVRSSELARGPGLGLVDASLPDITNSNKKFNDQPSVALAGHSRGKVLVAQAAGGFARGPAELGGWFAGGGRFALVSEGVLSVFDFERMALIGQDVVCPVPVRVFRFPESDRAFVACAAVFKGNQKVFGATLSLADAGAARVTARREVAAVPDRILVSGPGQTILLENRGTVDSKGRPQLPGRVEAVEARTLKTLWSRDVQADASVVWSPDSDRVFILEPGVYDDDPRKGKPAHVLTIDTGRGDILSDVDLGVTLARALGWDPDRRLAYVVTGRKDAKTATLIVIRGEETRVLDLPKAVFRVERAQDGDNYFLSYPKGLLILDGDLARVLGAIDLDDDPDGVIQVEPSSRLVVGHSAAFVSIVDRQAYRLVAKVSVGGGGRSFMRAFGQGMITAGQAQGMPWAFGLGLPPKVVVPFLSPDRRTVYVYSRYTGDLTVVDPGAGRSIEAIKFREPAVGVAAAGTRFVAGWGGANEVELKAIDFGTRKPASAIKFHGTVGTFSPDGSLAFISTLKGLAVFDLGSGSLRATLPLKGQPFARR
jgi:hypothetical protein